MSETVGDLKEVCDFLREMKDRSVTSLTEYTKKTLISSRAYIEDSISREEGMLAIMKFVNHLLGGFVFTAIGLGNVVAGGRTVRDMAQMISTEDFHSFLDVIKRDKDGNAVSRIVATDKGSYRVSLKARLRKEVVLGADMTKGDLLDESVRIYPFLNNVKTAEVIDHAGAESFSDWEFDPSTVGEFHVDPSSMALEGGHWSVEYRDDYDSSLTFSSGPSLESALSVELCTLYGEGESCINATRHIIREDPTYRVEAYAGTDFSVPLTLDIPSVTIPSGMIRAKTEYGVYAMWDMSEVKKDAKGRLHFDIGGSPADVKAFWEDVWNKADEMGVSMESLLGAEGTKVSPAAFFLNNLMGANTLFVVVDRSQIDDISMMRDPMFFDMLSAVVPSAIRLFLVEHRSVGDDDIAHMDEAAETGSVFAALPEAVDVAGHAGERVSIRFFRPPPAKVRG